MIKVIKRKFMQNIADFVTEVTVIDIMSCENIDEEVVMTMERVFVVKEIGRIEVLE